ncbi:hypothetical protein JW935_29275 [candidate division KSB1 bacterium]|nr:hypothetical protein [candidate division KSB1 bacterium]
MIKFTKADRCCDLAMKGGIKSGILYPPPPNGIKPLTVWLSETIDKVAGKKDGDPLTFGDLRHSPRPPALEKLTCNNNDYSIDLRTVTTCISSGRPMQR